MGELGRMGAALDITVWGTIGEVVRSLTLRQSSIDIDGEILLLPDWSFR